MSRLMRASAVTIYNSLGEVDRVLSYRRTVLAGARVETTEGMELGTVSVSRPADDVTLYIPGKVTGYVAPEDFDGEGWTLREGDLVAVGEGPDTPPETTYRIKKVHEMTLWGGRVHHWQVELA